MIETIEQHLKSAFPDADIRVQGEGGKFAVRIVDASFEGKMPVKRQQSVYAGLGDLISSGAVHAVSIDAKTPAEFAKTQGLEGN